LLKINYFRDFVRSKIQISVHLEEKSTPRHFH